MICGVVAISISGCGVCTVCRVVCGTDYRVDTLQFLSPTNASLYYTYKMLKYTVKISHDCSYMFRFKLHGTQYTPQLKTLFTNIAVHLTTYFY
jgi:hypothetical protein